MAIHGELPGISVTVRINNRSRKEYATSNDRSPSPDNAVQSHHQRYTKTVFIESQKNKAYTINIKVQKPFHMTSPCVLFRVFVDGETISKPLMRRKEFTTMQWEHVVDSPVPKSSVFGPDSAPTSRELKFGEIDAVDEGFTQIQIEEHKSRMSDVGDIVVKIYAVSEGQRVEATESTFKQKIEVGAKYHQKALVKDAKSHGTVLGDEFECSPNKTFKVKELDGVDFPMAVFKFKYRDYKGLQDLGFISSPTSSSTLTHTRFESLNAAEQQARYNEAMKTIQILNSIKQEQEQTPRGIKREFGLISPENSPPMKRAQVFSTLGVRPNKPVDLTSEDDEDVFFDAIVDSARARKRSSSALISGLASRAPRSFKHGDVYDLTEDTDSDDEVVIESQSSVASSVRSATLLGDSVGVGSAKSMGVESPGINRGLFVVGGKEVEMKVLDLTADED